MFRIPAIKFGRRIITNHNRLIDHFVGASGMKTGFICASGFNIVASAKRGNKRLIAVVLGGYSGARRNEDTARLLEKGFSPMASIAAVFRREPGTVESIQNLAVAPVNIQADICGGKRKRAPSESDIEDDAADNQDSDPAKGSKQPLLTDLPPSMDPISVSVVASPQAQAKMAEDEANGRGKRKRKGKASRNEPAEKPALAKVVAPQGGPFLPLSAQPVSTQIAADAAAEHAASPNQPLEFAPLKSSMAQFAPLIVRPSPPAPVAEPVEPVRRVVAAAGADAAPVAVKEQSTTKAGKSDALPRSAQAFAPENSPVFAPALRDLPADSEPPLQLPAIAPLPRPRPKP
jgi:D-alanyl-D-alanine carboxypeptidase